MMSTSAFSEPLILVVTKRLHLVNWRREWNEVGKNWVCGGSWTTELSSLSWLLRLCRAVSIPCYGPFERVFSVTRKALVRLKHF